MPKYVIERNLPGVGDFPPEDLAAIADRSCSVLRSFGSRVQWVESYVTNDRLYCIYIAPNEALLREHARLGDFTVNRIAEIKATIDPTTSEVAACVPTHDREHDLAKEAGVY